MAEECSHPPDAQLVSTTRNAAPWPNNRAQTRTVCQACGRVSLSGDPVWPSEQGDPPGLTTPPDDERCTAFFGRMEADDVLHHAGRCIRLASHDGEHMPPTVTVSEPVSTTDWAQMVVKAKLEQVLSFKGDAGSLATVAVKALLDAGLQIVPPAARTSPSCPICGHRMTYLTETVRHGETQRTYEPCGHVLTFGADGVLQ